ncbi:MAG: hypothetical protein OWR52_13080 [Acidibacillus sp.]|uniref:Uncharacterized protein n=1 Tax=Sulfoacidibacillus ferrooxidans TaxID=2005001 RepID=A0A9X1V9W2_9BACL|nr:hypothetical protein [Sulfoacidibacillus ferrooxidans]MCI0183929.1 hypothetical protein [Sulfoacidibacillus ferrooxidans]MCY0894416.1 hypothetical protein [Acidibacillus sp.]
MWARRIFRIASICAFISSIILPFASVFFIIISASSLVSMTRNKQGLQSSDRIFMWITMGASLFFLLAAMGIPIPGTINISKS